MAQPSEKWVTMYNTEAERDAAYQRRLEKDYMIATGQMKINKIVRRHGNKTIYGFEEKRA